MTTAIDIAGPIATAIDRVIEVFDAELRSDLPFVNRLVEHIRTYRGKMLRPKLLLLAGRAAGDLNEQHIVLGAVVEMVHMATLVHDDVLDQADLRRRGPTVNRVLDNQGAVLLGDYLISHAYHLCSSLQSQAASRRIAAVTNTVCEGELMQIEHRGDFELSEAAYFEIIRRKTAALTSVCCELGAAAAEADDDVVERLAAFGLDLGIAFQIVDDLLDLTGTESETGKTVGRDADLRKLTLPLIRFRDQACNDEHRRLMETLTGDDANITARVRSLLARSDAIDYAMDVARSHVQSAVSHLECVPAGEAKDALTTAAEYVLRRRQ